MTLSQVLRCLLKTKRKQSKARQRPLQFLCVGAAKSRQVAPALARNVDLGAEIRVGCGRGRLLDARLKLQSGSGVALVSNAATAMVVMTPGISSSGGSAYPRDWDYARLKTIVDKVGALLMCDTAHFSGLVAAQEVD
jgi:hypothetical protein